jgi:hypothetical protein
MLQQDLREIDAVLDKYCLMGYTEDEIKDAEIKLTLASYKDIKLRIREAHTALVKKAFEETKVTDGEQIAYKDIIRLKSQKEAEYLNG